MARPSSLTKHIYAQVAARGALYDAEERRKHATTPEQIASARQEAKAARATLRELNTPPKPLPRCGAKTRAGEKCMAYPVEGRKRCRMHGGTSRRGAAHPKYVHGLRSIAEREREQAEERELMKAAVGHLDLFQEIRTPIVARQFVDAVEQLRALRAEHRARRRAGRSVAAAEHRVKASEKPP